MSPFSGDDDDDDDNGEDDDDDDHGPHPAKYRRQSDVAGIPGSAVSGSAISGTNADGEPSHYGTKPGHFETSIILVPTSEGVSKVSGARERSE